MILLEARVTGKKLQLRKKKKCAAVNFETGKQDKSHGCVVQSLRVQEDFLHFVYDAKNSWENNSNKNN